MKINKKFKEIVHYSISMSELLKKFPELKKPIDKTINKFLNNKNVGNEECEFDKIIIGPKYSSSDSYPTILNIRFECYGGSYKTSPYTFTQTFKSTWKEF